MPARRRFPNPRLCVIPLTLGVAGLLGACGSSGNSGASSAAQSSPSASTGASGYSRGANAGGGSSSGASAAAKSNLTLTAREQGGLSFSAKSLKAKAGKVTITMRNPNGDHFPHGIAVEGKGVDKDGKIVRPGATSTLTVKLKPGKYTFYCPFDNHRAAGMRGTMVVR
jgi:plastocyanin